MWNQLVVHTPSLLALVRIENEICVLSRETRPRVHPLPFLALLLSVNAAAAIQTPLLPSQRIPVPTHALDRLFGSNQFATVPNFLDESMVADLATDVDTLRARLTPVASTPAHGSVEWLVLSPDAPPPDDADDARGVRAREALLHFVGDLRQHIESRTGVPLDAHCELKYAYYPCGGRYQKHVDGVAWRSSTVAREYSFLLYLNEGWQPGDGGHLRVFDLGGGGGHVDVPPAAGTLVVFKSDVVPHEVMPTFPSASRSPAGSTATSSPSTTTTASQSLSPRAPSWSTIAQGKDVRMGGVGA